MLLRDDRAAGAVGFFNPKIPAIRLEIAIQAIEKRRFPRAVSAEQTIDFARFKSKSDVLQNLAKCSMTNFMQTSATSFFDNMR